MENEIKVSVVEYRDRKSLLMVYKCPITGRLKTRSAKTADRKEAERRAAVWENELREGRYASPSKTTWAEFRERYETEVLPGLSHHSRTKCDVILDRIEAVLNPRLVRDVTAQRLSHFVAELRKETRTGDVVKPGLAEASIASYMAVVKAAINWAERVGLIVKAPTFPKVQRAKCGTMKGRPITTEEFERMQAKVESVVGKARAAEWQRYLRGLWFSGFRIGESFALSWDEGTGLTVDLSGKYAVVHIAAEGQKSRKAETFPVAPEFAAMLEAVPAAERAGYVFNPQGERRGRVIRGKAIRTISAIGRAAGVKVWTNPRSGKVKYATAHDLRRAFGTRWAGRTISTRRLQQMMRHADIGTTMKFYVGNDAQESASDIHAAYRESQAINKSINSADSGTVHQAAANDA